MRTHKDVCYDPRHPAACRLDLFAPDGDFDTVFVYFHGGGLEYGDKESADVFAPYLTSHGIAVVSANYRMYPNAAYPDFICDAAEAVAWANRYMKEEIGCDKLYVGGSSAGAYLSMMLCFDPRYLAPFKIKPTDIAGYIHDAGQPTTHFNVLRERGLDERKIVVDDIKLFGTYEFEVKLYQGISAKLFVMVGE